MLGQDKPEPRDAFPGNECIPASVKEHGCIMSPRADWRRNTRDAIAVH